MPGSTHSALSASPLRRYPRDWRKKLPRYPVPVALLGRLAVSQQCHGHGLSSVLLVDACTHVAAASETFAVAAIIADTKSPKAGAFYQHFDFIELPGQPGRWILSRVDRPGRID
ncbi:MAG: hypothetical protein RQ757_05100 [Pseudomonadales bacterium]|nr:hypothetical protein [Pseudomonadales bacterium]